MMVVCVGYSHNINHLVHNRALAKMHAHVETLA